MKDLVEQDYCSPASPGMQVNWSLEDTGRQQIQIAQCPPSLSTSHLEVFTEKQHGIESLGSIRYLFKAFKKQTKKQTKQVLVYVPKFGFSWPMFGTHL